MLRFKDGRAALSLLPVHRKKCGLPQMSSNNYHRNDATSNDKGNKIDDEFDKPIKYSTSKAATFPAAYTNLGPDVPWYQTPVITISLLAFMVYFFYLREENDIDEKMVEGLPPEVLEQIYGKPKPKK